MGKQIQTDSQNPSDDFSITQFFPDLMQKQIGKKTHGVAKGIFLSLILGGVFCLWEASFNRASATEHGGAHAESAATEGGGSEASHKISAAAKMRAQNAFFQCLENLDTTLADEDWVELAKARKTLAQYSALVASNRLAEAEALNRGLMQGTEARAPLLQRLQMLVAWNRMELQFLRSGLQSHRVVQGLKTLVQLVTFDHVFPQDIVILNSLKASHKLLETSALFGQPVQQQALKLQFDAFQSMFLAEVDRNRHAENFGRTKIEVLARPILFGAGGVAAFAVAFSQAEGILAFAEATGARYGAAGFAQVLGTGSIAALGSAGVATLVEIAIRRYAEAYVDSEKNEAPFVCSLAKQIELGREEEFIVIQEAARNGFLIGAGTAGFTMYVPKVMQFFAGVIETKAAAKGTVEASTLWVKALLRSASGLRKSSEYVDELVLFSVTGLVTAGGANEVVEIGKNAYFLKAIHDDLAEADLLLKNAELTARAKGIPCQVCGQLKTIQKELRTMKAESVGDLSEHIVEGFVIGFLLYHLAHGEFMEALKNELKGVIRMLGLTSDDVPTGLSAAGKSLANVKTVLSGKLVKAKYVAHKLALKAMQKGVYTVSLQRALDEWSDRDGDKFEEDLKHIKKILGDLEKEQEQLDQYHVEPHLI